MSRNLRSNRLGLESLESRQMLAGDVDAFAIGGTLTIAGDTAGNGILIRNTSEGVVQIIGLTQAGTPTTVNDQPNASFSNVQNIVIALNGGDDQLVLTNLFLKGSVSISLGEGHDVVGLGAIDDTHNLFDDAIDTTVGQLEIEGNIALALGNGNNSLVARDVVIGKWSGFSAGDGNDLFEFQDEGTIGQQGYVPAYSAGKGLTLITGNGTNTVNMRGATLQNLILPMGAQDDIVTLEDVEIEKTASIAGGDGANEYHLTRVTAKSIDISSGIGNDEYDIEELNVSKELKIVDSLGNDTVSIESVTGKSVTLKMGGGNDEITLEDITLTGSLDIDAGVGDDTVTLTDITAKSIDIKLGIGNDELTANNVEVGKSAAINAGDGDDNVEIDGLSAKDLTIKLGLGDDDLALIHVPIVKKVTLDGGAGENTLEDDVSFTYTKLKKTGFPVVG